MIKTFETYALTNENIDKTSEQFFAVCQELKMDRKESIKLRLAFENVLMTWKDAFEGEREFEFAFYTKMFAPHVAVRIKDEKPVNPLKNDDDMFGDSILSMLSSTPDYLYSAGMNTVVFNLRKPDVNPMLHLGIIFLFSIVVGVLGKELLPSDLIASLLTNFVEPLYSKFLEILKCIAGPMIFLSVAWGIYGIGDVATFNKIGKSLMGFFIGSAIAASTCAVLSFPLFGLSLSSGGESSSQVASILQLFLNMIPADIVSPFSTGNTIQIIVIAVLMGIALLYLGQKSTAVATLINGLNSIINFVLGLISKIVPLFISLILVNVIWSGKILIVADMWKLAVGEISSFILVSTVILIIASITVKVKPIVILKKLLEPTLLAFSTASSAASMGSVVEACEKKLGIDKSLVSFGVPLGLVAEKTVVSVSFTLVSLYVAQMSGIEISVGWLITAALVCAITAMAAPPIPGGASIAYAMLFAQLNLPTENIGVMLALDMVIDFAITAANVFCNPVTLLIVANKYDLIDRDLLNS